MFKALFFLFGAAALISLPAGATTVYRMHTVTVPVLTGTGFFITGDGYLITNQHVVEGCREVTIRGAVSLMQARVVATDEKHDLALLKADVSVRRVANLRELRISHLEIGEPVLIMGYPRDSFATGRYRIAEGKVVGLQGPSGEPDYIQFSDSARHGNSGGPLLDSAGNVAGVIVGKATSYRLETGTGREELIGESDIAISLAVLTTFLDENHINYRFNPSQGYQMSNQVEQNAKDYIVNIICERPDLKK